MRSSILPYTLSQFAIIIDRIAFVVHDIDFFLRLSIEPCRQYA